MDVFPVSSPPFFARRWLPWAALAYAGLIYVTLPPEAIAINDDFAYLKSVVQTAQRGRPWTNDWLEPWAGSFSGICALVFGLTSRFHLATVGVQAVLGGISFWALASLFVERGGGETRSMGAALLTLTFPTLLWKSLEFTGMTLHLPCLLLALLMAGRGRWVGFVVVWLLAIANRQSAIAWAVLPAFAVLEIWMRPQGIRKLTWWRPAVAVLAGVGCWLFVAHTMNKTISQTMITDQVFAHANWRNGGRALLIGISAFLVSVGMGATILRVCAVKPIAFSRPSRVATVVAVLLGLALLVYDGRVHLAREHACFDDGDGWLYTKLFFGLALAGWSAGGFTLRVGAVWCALGSLVLIGLRSEVWDYYLVDLAIFGLFAIAPREAPAETPARFEKSRASVVWWRWSVPSGVALVAAFHLFFLFHFKFRLDRGLAFCSVVERAMRQGELGPADLSFPPFGFIAWHLHPYFAAHEGKGSDNIGGFDIYQRRDVAVVHSRYRGGWLRRIVPVFRDEPVIDPAMVLVHEHRRVGWFFPADYWLVRLPVEKITPAQVPINFAEYRRVDFPLNDAEWLALVRGP